MKPLLFSLIFAALMLGLSMSVEYGNPSNQTVMSIDAQDEAGVLFAYESQDVNMFVCQAEFPIMVNEDVNTSRLVPGVVNVLKLPIVRAVAHSINIYTYGYS